MITRDNLHFTFRETDGYQKLWNIIFCEREAGKTTSLELDKMIFSFISKKIKFCYIVRRMVEITEDLIDSIEQRINRFLPDDKPISFIYSKKDLKDGVVPLYILINDKKELIGKIVGLSMQLQRLKKIAIPNIHAMIFDEYVCNPKMNESYLKQEFFKLEELYITLKRFEYKENGLRIYICGNPYSKYTPVICGLNIDTNKMKSGARIVGDNYIVECYKIKEELKNKILENNPLYKFDDIYKKYAFDGEYINDANINVVVKKPENFYLLYVFKINNRYIGIYKNNMFEDLKFYCQFIKSDISKRRDIICFDFDELVQGTIMLAYDERMKFQKIKDAMRKREIAFQSIECYYLTEEIYFNL